MRLTAYQVMETEHEKGEPRKLDEHRHFHAKDKATLSICYLEHCPLPPLINYSIDSLMMEVEIMTSKEYKVMCDKDFLKDFSVRDKKMILGKRYE